MTASKLDRRVQFERFTLVDDGFGQVETWADLGDPVAAHKADLSDGELWRASAVQATVTTRFLVRWSSLTSGITAADRLTCEGQTYNITGTKETEGRRKFIEITAVRTND